MWHILFISTALHILSKDPSEPDVTIINPAIPSATISFNFDGMCNVAVEANPDRIDTSISVSGTVITVTVSGNAATTWGVYSANLISTNHGRSWPTVSATVFYGLEIQGLQVSA